MFHIFGMIIMVIHHERIRGNSWCWLISQCYQEKNEREKEKGGGEGERDRLIYGIGSCNWGWQVWNLYGKLTVEIQQRVDSVVLSQNYSGKPARNSGRTSMLQSWEFLLHLITPEFFLRLSTD